MMWTLHQLAEVGSTNTFAKQRLGRGAAGHGDVFTAEHQTAGRGRMGNRAWRDAAGEALLMSVVLEHLTPGVAEFAQYLCGLVVLAALRTVVATAHVDGHVRLKWPNDILLDGRKVCGVLSEALWQSNVLKGIVLGVGVNVRQTDFPPDVPLAISLYQRGVDCSVAHVRDVILSELEARLLRLQVVPEVRARMEIISELRTELEWLRHAGALRLREGAELSDVMYYDGVTDDGMLTLRGADATRVVSMTGSLEFVETGSLEFVE